MVRSQATCEQNPFDVQTPQNGTRNLLCMCEAGGGGSFDVQTLQNGMTSLLYMYEKEGGA